MTQYYLPQAPASAEVLMLPEVSADPLIAEQKLRELADSLKIQIKFDPAARKQSPIGLFPTQKLSDFVKFDRLGAKEIVGTSQAGRRFMAIALSDGSMLMGQMNPLSGMVKVFPFPLHTQNCPTEKDLAKEFDAWDDICNAAPKLHLNTETPPRSEEHKIPTWLAATLVDDDEHRKLRQFSNVAATAFCARYEEARSEKAITANLYSRSIKRDGQHTAAYVEFKFPRQNPTLKLEMNEFIREICTVLDGPASPVPPHRQIHLQSSDDTTNPRLDRLCLGGSKLQPDQMTSHEMIEAAAAWTEMLRQSN